MKNSKIKAAGWGAKAAFKNTNISCYSKLFNSKAQSSIRSDCLPSPFVYYKKIFPNIKQGSEWVNACCCFHNDSNPSLSINLKSGGFFCHACHAKGGDVLAFHQQHFKLGFKEALLQLKKIMQGEVK